MSDIEDELLMLAGGDASDSEDDSRQDSRSPSPAPQSASKSQSTSKKTPSKAKGRAGSHDASEDEGEASSAPGSPDSQMSAPMDESDSDDDSPQSKTRGGADDELNQYPVDGLFKDYEEKEHIMSLREIERETILAERREENERIRQNRMLRQLKVNQEKDNKKRKASAADLDTESSRKASRTRIKGDGVAVDKMDSLRRAREERSSRKEQRERENDRRKQRSPSYTRRSRGRDDDDSDIEWDGPQNSRARARSRTVEKESVPASLRDFERIRVGRSRFADFCFNPGFEEAITGCYVRISIGPDPNTKQDVYRMAVIKGFSTGRPYAMPDSTGQQMVVDMYVKAAHGKAQREWPFIACSDRYFTESEYNRYKQVLLSEGLTLPDKGELDDKIKDINGLLMRKWTEEELQKKFERQNKLRAKFSGAERDHLLKQIDHARARGDEEAVNRLQEKLDKLEIPRLAFKTSLNPKNGSQARSGSGSGAGSGSGDKKALSQQERLAQLNFENRRKNVQDVRRAQLKERAKARAVDEKLARGEALANEDHSRRLRTKMKFLHDEKETTPGADGKKDSRESTPAAAANGATNKAGASTLPPHIAKLQEQQRLQAAKSGIPVIHKPLMDDEIIGAMDLDIDIEL